MSSPSSGSRPLGLLAAALLWVMAAQSGAEPLAELWQDAQWRGAGDIRRAPGEPAETIRCRVETQAHDAGSELTMHGRCAVASGQSQFRMRALLDGETVRAAILLRHTGETTQYLGTTSETGLDLLSTEPIEVNGISYRSRIRVMREDGAQFSLIQHLQGMDAKAEALVTALRFRQTGQD